METSKVDIGLVRVLLDGSEGSLDATPHVLFND